MANHIFREIRVMCVLTQV